MKRLRRFLRGSASTAAPVEPSDADLHNLSTTARTLVHLAEALRHIAASDPARLARIRQLAFGEDIQRDLNALQAFADLAQAPLGQRSPERILDAWQALSGSLPRVEAWSRRVAEALDATAPVRD